MSTIGLIISSLFLGMWIGLLLGMWIVKHEEVKPLVSNLKYAEAQIRAYEEEFTDMGKMLNIAVGFVKDHMDSKAEGMVIGRLSLDAKATMDAINKVRS